MYTHLFSLVTDTLFYAAVEGWAMRLLPLLGLATDSSRAAAVLSLITAVLSHPVGPVVAERRHIFAKVGWYLRYAGPSAFTPPVGCETPADTVSAVYQLVQLVAPVRLVCLVVEMVLSGESDLLATGPRSTLA